MTMNGLKRTARKPKIQTHFSFFSSYAIHAIYAAPANTTKRRRVKNPYGQPSNRAINKKAAAINNTMLFFLLLLIFLLRVLCFYFFLLAQPNTSPMHAFQM